jgi:undecaprenyl-diphosphatase
MNIDYSISHFLNQFTGKSFCFDKLLFFFAEYFQFFIVFILLLFLVVNYRKYLKMVIGALAAAIVTRLGFAEIIRFLVPRSRPFVVDKSINLLVPQNPAEPSFPSGHASFFFALAAVVYFYNKKAGAIFFVFAFFISISRVFAGLHWFTDILAGAVVGIFTGWLVFVLSKRFIKK